MNDRSFGSSLPIRGIKIHLVNPEDTPETYFERPDTLHGLDLSQFTFDAALLWIEKCQEIGSARERNFILEVIVLDYWSRWPLKERKKRLKLVDAGAILYEKPDDWLELTSAERINELERAINAATA